MALVTIQNVPAEKVTFVQALAASALLTPEQQMARAEAQRARQRELTLARMTADEQKAWLAEEARVAAQTPEERTAEALLIQRARLEAKLAQIDPKTLDALAAIPAVADKIADAGKVVTVGD